MRRWRRGGYLVVIAVMLTVGLTVGTFLVDTAYIGLAAIQAQGAADAGAHAALVELKRGGSLADAREVARKVMAHHRVAGESVQVDVLQDVIFGGWDFGEGAFDPATDYVNAVQVRVRRTQGSPGGPVDLLLGVYSPHLEVSSPRPAVAALPSQEVVVLLDMEDPPVAEAEALTRARFGTPDRVAIVGGCDAARLLPERSRDRAALVLLSDGRCDDAGHAALAARYDAVYTGERLAELPGILGNIADGRPVALVGTQ